jgi:PEP-CTERM motif
MLADYPPPMSRPTLAVATSLLLILLLPSRGVIVSGGDGTQSTTAPVTNDFGFANVGQVFDTADAVFVSGVYLGNGWMISAYHGVRNGSGGFSFGNVILAGISYTVDAQSAVRLTTGSDPADLAVFHLAGPEPSLPSVSLSGVTPVSLSNLAMAGNGRNRAATETHWNVNTMTEPDIWTITPSPGDRRGFFYSGGATMRWGNNTRTADTLLTSDTGFGITTLFRTSFSNDPTAVTNEAQGAPGDSGGGVFYHNGLNWELSGIMLAVGGFDGQPAETAVFGNQTFIADIATYRSQIVSIVPEPSTGVLVALGALGLAVRRRTLALRRSD